MKTKIFYFSTTGNSFALARDLGNRLGGAELISIPKVVKGYADTDASCIGFVFPVYGWGIPLMVVEFIKGLKFKSGQYIFAVATCGGTPGRTLKQLRGILRKSGAELSAGFVTREGANTLTEAPGLVHFMRRISGIEYQSGKERLPEMLSIIRERNKYRPDTSSFAANFVGGLLCAMSSLVADSFKSYDKSFHVDDKCTNCKTCERICPMANVKVSGGKPVWNHNCSICYACIQWCPQQAIHIKNETCRYRNPEVTAQDLFLR